MCSYLENSNCDILLLTETWLNPNISDSEVLLDSPDFHIFRKDRIGRAGGGVLIAIKSHITSFVIDIPSRLEIVWVCSSSHASKTIFGVCYRPPDCSESFVTDLHDNLTNLRSKFPKADVFLLGDFNYPEIDWSNLTSLSRNSREFLDLTLDFSFVQLIDQPTRQHNILDLLLSSAPEKATSTLYLDGLSDHRLIQVSISLPASKPYVSPRPILDYKRGDYQSINQSLVDFSHSFMASFFNRSVNENWCLYKEKLLSLVHEHIPRLTIRVNTSKPWFTRTLRTLRNKKKRLFSKAKLLQSSVAWAKHRDSDKVYCHAVRQAKHKFFSHDLQSLLKNDPKKFWKSIAPTRSNTRITILNSAGVTVSPESCPVVFNNYFTSVFTKENYTNMPLPPTFQYRFMDPIEINPAGISSLITNLKTSTCSGVDGINSKILKHTVVPSSTILGHIFQQSLQTGEIPYDWKIAKVIPVFKSGDKCLPSNYRPISLTSIPCKLLEHIISSHVASHLEQNQYFFKNQHGFRKGLSCDTQLIEFTHEIFNNMDENLPTDSIFIDFSKAFDRVAHCRLIAKVSSLNLDSLTVSWIRNFLCFRKQCTVIDNMSSPLSEVTSGVPQGSVIGPLLFLIFINDLPSDITSSIRLFADDCIIYRKITSPSDHTALQQDLDRVTTWCSDWQMSLNVDKCNQMTFTRKRSLSTFQYFLDGSPLRPTSSYKYLGIHLASNLSWASHINKITADASRTLGYLKRNLRDAPPTTRKLAYQTLVRPKLEYASSIWSPDQDYLSRSLESVQNRAARFITGNYSRHSSVTKIKQSLSLSSLASRRNISLLCLLHRIINSKHSFSLPLLKPHRYSRRLQHNLSFQRLYGHTNAYNSSSLPRAIVLWNNLPENIANVKETEIFRGLLEKLPLEL